MSNTSRLADSTASEILKMIEEDRYCIDISNQLLAVESIIGKANKE